jgi:hypothetical protein
VVIEIPRGKPAHFVRRVEAKRGVQGAAGIRGMEHNAVRPECRCPFHHYTHQRPCDSLASVFALSEYIDNQRDSGDLDARSIVRDPRELLLDVRPGARDHLIVIVDREPPDIGAICQGGGQRRSGFVEQFPGEVIRRNLAHLPKHFNAMSGDSCGIVQSTGADAIVGHPIDATPALLQLQTRRHARSVINEQGGGSPALPFSRTSPKQVALP